VVEAAEVVAGDNSSHPISEEDTNSSLAMADHGPETNSNNNSTTNLPGTARTIGKEDQTTGIRKVRVTVPTGITKVNPGEVVAGEEVAKVITDGTTNRTRAVTTTTMTMTLTMTMRAST